MDIKYLIIPVLAAIIAPVLSSHDAHAGTIKSQVTSSFADQVFDYSEFNHTAGFYEFKERNTAIAFGKKGNFNAARYQEIGIFGSNWTLNSNRKRYNAPTNAVGITEFELPNEANILPNAKITLGLADVGGKGVKNATSNSKPGANKIKIAGYVGDGESTRADEQRGSTIATITTAASSKASNNTDCFFGCAYFPDVTDFVKNTVNAGNKTIGFNFKPGDGDTFESFGLQAELFVEDDPLDIIMAKPIAPENSKSHQQITNSFSVDLVSVDAEKNPAFERISITFEPRNSLGHLVNIDDLAKELDYDHFNFLQIIEEVPPYATVFTGTGKRVVHQGTITTPLGTGKFFDPLFKGNLIISYDNFDNLSPESQTILNKTQLNQEDFNFLKSNLIPADTFPYYLDVPGYELGDFSYQSQKSSFGVFMSDIPNLVFNPTLDNIQFITMLVGVKEDRNEFDVFNGVNVRWTSNTTCKTNCDGGIEINTAASLIDSLTSPVIGGVEILDTGITFDEISDDLLQFLTNNSASLIDFGGTSFDHTTGNTNNSDQPNADTENQKVSEPSTLLGLIFALGIGVKFTKDRKLTA